MATLFEQWTELIETRTEETFQEFWEEYSGAETKIYSDILDRPAEKMQGRLGELAEKYQVRPVIFMGFLDGINESIVNANDVESFDEESEIEVEIVPEKLFYNMIKADADYLFGLPQWEDILGRDKMAEIVRGYKASKTVRREQPFQGWQK